MAKLVGLALVHVPGHGKDFFEGRQASRSLAEAALAKGDHPRSHRVALDLVSIRAVDEHATDLGVHREHLVERHAARVAYVAAVLAAAAAIEHLGPGSGGEQGQLVRARLVWLLAVLADLAYQPLGGGDVDGGGDQKRI